MWLLSFLPEWVFHLIVLVGVGGIVAAFLLRFIPFISRYRLPVLLLGIALTSFGAYFEGQISNNKEWEARVKEMEVKVAQAEAKAAQENVKIITKYKERVNIIKENTDENVKLIEKYVSRYDDTIILPNSFIVLHDSASKNEIPGGSGASDESPSNVTASQFLSTVTNNYGTCYEIREIAASWQEWYKVQKEIFDNTFSK